jgi:hypothetical protein
MTTFEVEFFVLDDNNNPIYLNNDKVVNIM